jgi:stage III sporulation protein AH
MKMENVKKKFTAFCRKIGKKNMMIAGAFVIVAVALVVALAVFGGSGDKGFDYSQGTGLKPDSTDGAPTGTDTSGTDSYFSTVQLSRQRNRDEALEVLQSVVDNDSATETAKNEALAEINNLARVMEAEANIETLIVAKGFEECVAVISGESASIVVRSEGLQAAQISQINEIVYEQAGIMPTNVKIIER